MNIKAPRGTKDIFGDDIFLWHKLESMLRDICRNFGINEIRTPVFENTELFQRGVGETTDIVTKEMYTLEKKGNESLTLKPEGTAGAVRAFVEHGMYSDAQPTKLFYITPAFRYERPQAGRQRQFHQFGVELYGSYSPSADAEVISVVYEILNKIGIKNITLKINSLGGNLCRNKYNEVLKNFIGENIESLCSDCKERFEKNPLRVLDCKNDNCKTILENAPSVLDCLDKECKEHFEMLKKYLNNLNIPFVIDTKLVRGLDYYTRTVFEFVSNEIGSQGTICAGGRYDNLISECGGPDMGAVGFAFGMERMLILIKEHNLFGTDNKNADIFIGSIGENGILKSQALAYDLRKAGLYAEFDTLNRSVKAQMKYANKINAEYTVIIGDDEITNDLVVLKNMQSGEKNNIKLSAFKDEFIRLKNI